jgi:23S rRNA (cytosine1962-C5)-methyltransferase
MSQVHKSLLRVLRVSKDIEKSVKDGMPWIRKSELPETAELLECEAGALVEIRGARDTFIAIGTINPRSPITVRILTSIKESIDTAFFIQRFEAALKKREAKIKMPFYRLIHAESDGLPGLIIDRFDDIFVVQVSTAGMEQLQPQWMQALESLFAPKVLVLRNDIPARVLEGLKEYVQVVKGTPPPLVEVKEYDAIFLADLLKGQKTGWFYDQRDNRHMMAKLSNGKTVLDVFSHSGGFAIPAARMGASEVTLVDASELALDLAKQAATKNNVLSRMNFLPGDAFEVMQRLAKDNQHFDIVVSDPPAFIPARKDIGAGLKGYEKVAKFSAALVTSGGHLFIASCSHHASRALFRKAVLDGIKKAGRKGEIIKQTGAANDHPVYPKLPQSEYLKGVLLKMG